VAQQYNVENFEMTSFCQ